MHSVSLLVAAIVVLCVIYWRIAIRLVAITVIFLIIYGAIMFAEGVPHAGR